MTSAVTIARLWPLSSLVSEELVAQEETLGGEAGSALPQKTFHQTRFDKRKDPPKVTEKDMNVE